MATHLSASQLEQLRSELERQLKKLQRSMRTTNRVMKPVQLDQSSVGRLSRIDNLQTQGLTAGLQAREQANSDRSWKRSNGWSAGRTAPAWSVASRWRSSG
jgi:hypothetical protein